MSDPAKPAEDEEPKDIGKSPNQQYGFTLAVITANPASWTILDIFQSRNIGVFEVYFFVWHPQLCFYNLPLFWYPTIWMRSRWNW